MQTKIKFVANPVFLYHDKLEKLVNEALDAFKNMLAENEQLKSYIDKEE